MGRSNQHRPIEQIALQNVYIEQKARPIIDELYELLGFKHFCWLIKRLEGYSSVEIAKKHGVTRQAVENALRLKLQQYNPDLKNAFREGKKG